MITLRLTATTLGVNVAVAFRYTASEPFAVTLRFTSVKGRPEWWISRDLLLEGLRYGSGTGDVLIRPWDDGIDITLRSPSGIATLTFDTYELLDALRATEALVPLGQERFDFDAEIARLGVSS
jgi:hypothetical protein